MSNPLENYKHTVSTGGGAYIDGHVDTAGGEFIGHDKITVEKFIANFFSRERGQDHAVRQRKEMLRLVEDTWINGFLLPSLAPGYRLYLQLEGMAELVDNHPFAELVQMPDVPFFSIKPEDEIVEVFQRAQQRLLIVGDPGSGKTTLLLLIAQAMLVVAQIDDAQPIPVVLNLASWSPKHGSLHNWLLGELKEKYLVPTKMAEPWLVNDDLLLLLDGLDEVNEIERESCVLAINQFLTEHRVAIVVCSRKTEYRVLHTHLRLPIAVQIQPLTQQQIDAYLHAVQLEQSELAVLIASDPQVRDLASAPLLLHVMTVAAEHLPTSTELSSADWQSQLFATYLTTMFHRRSGRHPYTPDQTVRWLRWLARQMINHGQSIFLLEQMQPTFLANRQQRLFYHTAVRLSVALLFLVTCSLSAMLAVLASTTNTNTLLAALGIGLEFGIVVTLALLVASILALWISELFAALLTIGIVAVVLRLIGGFSITDSIIASLVFSLLGSLPGLFIAGRRPIRPIDGITWSLPRLRLRLLLGFIGSVVFGFIISLMSGVSDGLEMGLMVGMCCILPGILFGMSRSDSIKPSIVPNQGIRTSLRTSTIVFGVMAVSSGLIGFILRILVGGESYAVGVALGVVMAIPIGLVAALIAGGAVCIQHYFLCIILAYSGVVPWHYQHFLDYATDHVFLRRIGGGYIFYHRLLMEYLASDMEITYERK